MRPEKPIDIRVMDDHRDRCLMEENEISGFSPRACSPFTLPFRFKL